MSACARNQNESSRRNIRPVYGFLLAIVVSGCASPGYVALRGSPLNPLGDRLSLQSRSGPKPSDRTVQFLRSYDLAYDPKAPPRTLLVAVQRILDREPTADGMYAAAELAYIGGKNLQAQKDASGALKLYGAAVTHAYLYLLDPRYAEGRNPFDPQFRQGCDVYNGALEAALRTLRDQGALRPGVKQTIESSGQRWEINIVVRGGLWRDEDFGRVEFVSDYETKGLQNEYHTYGLGVPLIVVRNGQQRADPAEPYYAPGLAFPMTAFVRVVSTDPLDSLPVEPPLVGSKPEVLSTAALQPQVAQTAQAAPARQAVVELYDPLSTTQIDIGDRRVPLETDLTTPLAYCLDDKAFQQLDQPTLGLLRPDSNNARTGLYMLEPFQPEKIPVLMIHGLWSTPLTWMEMFNDLHASPELRQNYQFWFYEYPTGQPFWQSAAELRETLVELRARLDPQHRSVALDQMVLVGHSMGGLIARLQSLDSRDDVWRLVSKVPPLALKADAAERTALTQEFFFEPNPSVRRVITIATPHRGSQISNETTQWIGRKLISFSKGVVVGTQQLRTANPGLLADPSLLDVTTSIDSLSPKSPILPVMLRTPRGPWITYHNIVGRLPQRDWLGRVTGDGDGVVPFSSAHLDDVASELVVPAAHMDVHRHPLAILEVRRILLEQAAELRQNPYGPPRTAAASPQPGVSRDAAAERTATR